MTDRRVLQEAMEAARANAAVIARHDPAAFNMFCLRDDEDPSAPFENAPMHDAMHALISAHPRLCLLAHAEAGKTVSVSVGRTLWELGRNPNLRIAVVSETDEKAQELVSTIRKYIEESRELAMVFPNLRPSRLKATDSRSGRDAKWTMHALTVERTSFARDPSIRACGVFGTVQGARIDLLIVDDICTWRTARTAAQRKKLSAWFKQSLGSRLTRRSRVVFLNTAYHPDDLVHEYSRRPGYVSRSFPMRQLDTAGVWQSTWPRRYKIEDIERKIADDLGGEGSPEVLRQIDCKAQREGSISFREEWIEKALALGDGLTLLHSLSQAELAQLGAFTISGVDIGIGKKETSGRSCIATLLIFPYGARFEGAAPDGSDLVYPPGTRQLVGMESGHWDAPEIVKRCHRAHKRFGSVVFVEDNAAQMLLVQFMSSGRVTHEDGTIVEPFPVLPFHTSHNKWDPAFGVAAIGIEMSQGRWAIPNAGGVLAPEASALIGEVTAFAPDVHTGDRLMALWIANTGARTYEYSGSGNVGARVIGKN